MKGGLISRRGLGAPARSLGGRSVLAADAVVGKLADRTVAPSRSMSEFLVRVVGVPAQKVAVVHNGVEVDPPLSLPSLAEVFVTASSIVRRKGIFDLLGAFGSILPVHPRLRLVVVGEGEDLAACEQLVRSRGIAGYVDFRGFRSDVRAELRGAHAFVLASWLENFPLSCSRQ